MRRFLLTYLLLVGLFRSVTGFGCDAVYGRFIAEAHQSISTDLFNGRIEDGYPLSKDGNNHSVWRVKIYNEKTGRWRWAIFKPRSPGDEDGWARAPMEYVAYELNRMLNMDYVPPVSYRRWLDVRGTKFDEGALIYEMPGAKILYDTPAEQWNVPSSKGVVSDNRVLNVLLQNQDGHYKNLLIGNHWVDGRVRPAFIDFGASLRQGTSVTMTNYDAFRNSEPVEYIRYETLEALRRLEFNYMKSKFGEFMSDAEIGGMLARRDGIVQYFDKLKLERGDAAVYVP